MAQGFARIGKAARLLARCHHHSLAALGLNINNESCAVATQRDAHHATRLRRGFELIQAKS